MVLVRKWIIIFVIFCLLGTLTQACHDTDKDKNEENEVEEKEETPKESGSDITKSKWFIILDRLIERYPIIARIIERIFQWIFNNLLDMDY